MNFAVVFPGQGSQSVGMLAELASSHSLIEQTFVEAADVLGTDYWQLAQNGPDTELADTRVTQPLMFISGVAMWRALRQAGAGLPSVIAGHSLGEFTAMVASGALEFADALGLVQQRAQLMSEAVPAGEGGMAALIGMDDDDVVKLCNDLTGDRIVEAVNFNAPGQVAISGHIDALEKAVVEAKERGARKGVMLPVSVPNHSSLMKGAGETLAETIAGLKWVQPGIPVVQNAQAKAPQDIRDLKASLKEHVYSPVQWTKSVQTMRDEYDVSLVIECGPGKVLSGLGKRIDKTLKHQSTDKPESFQAALDALMENA